MPFNKYMYSFIHNNLTDVFVYLSLRVYVCVHGVCGAGLRYSAQRSKHRSPQQLMSPPGLCVSIKELSCVLIQGTGLQFGL